MSTEHPRVTPEQAQEQLANSRTKPLSSIQDRTVHAVGTAVFGLSLGFFMAARNMVSGAGEIVLTVLFVVALVAQEVWVERAARTVPRGARLWSRLGIGASLALALALVLPWLNLQAQTEPDTWSMALVGALVVAVPSLTAAAVIARGRK